VEDGDEQDFSLEEEDDPIIVPLPELEVPRNIINELSNFISKHIEEEDEMNRIVRDCLDDLYEQFDEPEQVTDLVLSYVQRRHGWDLEVVMSESDVEEALFRNYDGYDPEMWQKAKETHAIKELHYEIYKLSKMYAKEAVREILEGNHPTRKQPRKRRRFW
jgi:hypothetical protein